MSEESIKWQRIHDLAIAYTLLCALRNDPASEDGVSCSGDFAKLYNDYFQEFAENLSE